MPKLEIFIQDNKEVVAKENWREKRKEKDRFEISTHDLTWEVPDKLMDRLNKSLKLNRFVDTKTLILESICKK